MSVRTSGTVGYSYNGSPLQFEPEQYISNKASDRIIAGNGPNELYGFGGNDTLYGMNGDDLLVGGAGKDKLYGGSGSDYFLFDKAPSSQNIDTIQDFKRGQHDKIVLRFDVFQDLEAGVNADASGNFIAKEDSRLNLKTYALNATSFCKGPQALDLDDRVVYDPATGILSYDSDGSGPAAAIQIAKLKVHTSLAASDFIIY